MEEVKRALLSKTFLASMLLAAFVFAAGAQYPEFTGLLGADTHFLMLQKALESDVVTFMVPLLSVLPFTTAFTEEVRNGYAKFYLLRTNRKKYLLGKILAAWVSGAAVLMGGFGLVLSAFWMLFAPMEAAAEGSQVLGQAIPLFWRLGMIGGLCALLGTYLAVLVMSNYMAYIAPFVMWYFLIMLSERYFPKIYTLYPKEWLQQQKEWGKDGRGLPLFLTFLTVFLGILCYQKMKERLKDV